MNQPIGGDTPPSEEPPAVGGGGMALPPGQPLPRRRVRGVAGQQLQPTTREIVPELPGAGPAGIETPQGQLPSSFGYTGQNLVDSSGTIVRSPYTVGGDSDEAYAELARMGTGRFAFLNALASLGIYSGPSTTGYASKDLSAMRQAMLVANTEGVTVDVVLPLIAAKYGSMRGGKGGGARIRTTPTQDLREVFKQVSLSVLGRALPESEIDRFVRSYQRQEVSQAMGGATAPSAQVAAQTQIEQAQGDEAAAVGMLQLANLFDATIKGLA